MMRKILHVDMDAFYASIEQRDNPALRGKPIAVGRSGEERGVVAAASYEARAYGVFSAMSSRTALARCPKLIFVPARFEVYRAVSMQIRKIFRAVTDFVEPLSLDEAYLDVTHNRLGAQSATILAREIKRLIKRTTGLNASAGVSVNKFLAKIASDYDKPDGLFVIGPDESEAFVEKLKIERFWGVGRITAEKMHRLGIHTGADLKQWSEADLVAQFGKAGHTYYQNARGIDERPVEPNRIRKSVGAETTFLNDTSDRLVLGAVLDDLSEDVWARLTKHGTLGRTVTLKVKYEDFEELSRRVTHGVAVESQAMLRRVAGDLLGTIDVTRKKVRLLGVTVSNFNDDGSGWRQLEIDFGEF